MCEDATPPRDIIEKYEELSRDVRVPDVILSAELPEVPTAGSVAGTMSMASCVWESALFISDV
jgi:hypothetical protein